MANEVQLLCKLITYSTSSAGPGLPPFQWTWRMRPLWPWSLTPPGPSSSCCRGWGCAAGWTEQGCRAPLSPRWASGSSYPGSPGSPGAPSSTNPPHPPPQIPVNSLGRHQLQKDETKLSVWTQDFIFQCGKPSVCSLILKFQFNQKYSAHVYLLRHHLLFLCRPNQ